MDPAPPAGAAFGAAGAAAGAAFGAAAGLDVLKRQRKNKQFPVSF